MHFVYLKYKSTHVKFGQAPKEKELKTDHVHITFMFSEIQLPENIWKKDWLKYLKVYLEKLIYKVQHAPLLAILWCCSTTRKHLH